LFFEEACCIIASDGVWHEAEARFLEHIASQLGISTALRFEIQERYRNRTL
jgi:tellurite resistance protein